MRLGKCLQFRIDFSFGKVVDVVAQGCQSNTHDDFNGLLLVVACIEESFQLVVGYRAFFRHNGLGECRQSTQFGIVKLACSQCACGFDGLFGQQFFSG